MGHIGWFRLCHARLRHFIVLRRISLQMPNSHRPPDKTRRFCMCRVYCAGLNWTIALNVFRRQIFCRRQSSVVRNPIYTADADSTQTRQFCRAWRTGRCELAFRLTATRTPLAWGRTGGILRLALLTCSFRSKSVFLPHCLSWVWWRLGVWFLRYRGLRADKHADSDRQTDKHTHRNTLLPYWTEYKQIQENT